MSSQLDWILVEVSTRLFESRMWKGGFRGGNRCIINEALQLQRDTIPLRTVMFHERFDNYSPSVRM